LCVEELASWRDLIEELICSTAVNGPDVLISLHGFDSSAWAADLPEQIDLSEIPLPKTVKDPGVCGPDPSSQFHL
jgi:hypothetical protein